MKKISLSLFLPLLIFSFTFFITGCGRKGPPEAPTGSTYVYPQPYPSEE